MVEKANLTYRRESEPNGLFIDRLCAAVRLPAYSRKNVLFVGWTADGKPTISYESSSLSPQALESYKITKTSDFPLSRDYAQLPIIPIEFVAQSTPIDRQDTSRQMTEDILNVGVSDKDGQVFFLKVEELDMLEAIIQGQVKWEDINTRTIYSQDTIPSLPMYTVFFNGKNEQDADVVYALLFKPTMQNESNDLTYQQFLVQTIKSFLTLDSKQKPNAKKGYERAVQLQIGTQEVIGSDAFIVMNALRKFGIVDISDARLEELKKESSGKNFTYQLKLLAREAGIVSMDIPESSGDRNQLDSFSTDELLGIIRLAHRFVSRNFEQGR